MRSAAPVPLAACTCHWLVRWQQLPAFAAISVAPTGGLCMRRHTSSEARKGGSVSAQLAVRPGPGWGAGEGEGEGEGAERETLEHELTGKAC